jgi:ABC-type branched-subunit amino acid transport system substrate-binding protein
MIFMKKCNSLILLLLFILSGCSFGKSNQTVQCIPIKIGVIIADDNMESGFEQKKGYDMALAEINQEGGIQGCPVELVYEKMGEEASTESAQVAIMQLAEQNVLAILGGTSNEVTMQAATIASYFKVPLIIPSTTNDEITEVGNQWIFRLRASNASDAKIAFEMVRGELGLDAKVVILYEQTPFGESSAVVSAASAMANGLTVAGYYSYSNQDGDFSLLAEEVIDIIPEVIYIISSDAEVAANLLGVFQSQQVSSNMVIGHGPAFTERSFLYDGDEMIYDNLENLILITNWSVDLPWVGLKEFNQEFQIFSQNNNYNYSVPVARNVEAYTSLQLLGNALSQITLKVPQSQENLELTDEKLKQSREDLASSLRNLNTDQRETLFGSVVFDGAGQNRQSSVLVQVLNGNIVTVYPPRYAVQSPYYISGW